MNEEEVISRAADRIWLALNSNRTCKPVRSLIGDDAISRAYRVQQINTQRRLERGENIIGAKIGLTSEAVQKQLGVDQPDYGILTNQMRMSSDKDIPWSELHQPKAEAEIAFVLSQDLSQASVTMGQLKQSIASVVACIEIVGSRIEDWDIKIADTIADNASASHFVLGDTEKILSEVDLEHCTMTMRRDGELVSQGSGKACMGNPLNAALWLAQTMHEFGTPLRAGDIILAGALGPMVAAHPGDKFEAHIEGLGEVSVSFGQAD